MNAKQTMSQFASLDDLLAAQAAERVRDAAPDLLAALKKALTQLDLQHDHDFGKSAPGAVEDSARSEARAAISKATGA